MSSRRKLRRMNPSVSVLPGFVCLSCSSGTSSPSIEAACSPCSSANLLSIFRLFSSAFFSPSRCIVYLLWSCVVLLLTSSPSLALSATDVPDVVTPVYGNLFRLAYFFVDILVGSPPQRQSVIIDTGSSLLGFPCQGCTKCGEHIDLKFDLHASSTGKWLPCSSGKCADSCVLSGEDRNKCRYSQHYAEGSSINGFYVSDLVAIGSHQHSGGGITYDFIGCHMVETNLFTTQEAAGIVGMSYRRRANQPTLVDQLFTVLEKKVFAICLSEDGGEMSLGGFTDKHHRSSGTDGRKDQVQWVNVKGSKSYSVPLTSITIDGKTAGSKQSHFGPAVVDSGTTYTYLPSVPFEVVRKTLAALCTSTNSCNFTAENNPCWAIKPGNSFPSFLPTMKVSLGDVSIDWLPDSYLYYSSNNRWCLGIAREHSTNTVLGMSFFKNKHVIFDRGENKIGFVVASCPSSPVSTRGPRPGEQPTPVKAEGSTASLPESVEIAVEDFTPIATAPDFSPRAVWSVFAFGIGMLLSAVLVIIRQTLRTPAPAFTPLGEAVPSTPSRRRRQIQPTDEESLTSSGQRDRSLGRIDVAIRDSSSLRPPTIPSSPTELSSDYSGSDEESTEPPQGVM
eukprot:GHVS01051563.1.p1 GENE.GHVS01051563.1~~GHVS01051563.1.p1  ORF type:complete len:641 (-),score=99.04 GHVS01051563.1:1256-3109(-)